MSLNFCFLGAGNVATQLSKIFQNKGFRITQVYSRTEQSAKKLADSLSTNFTTSINAIDENADVFFVALKDSAIDEVLQQIDFKNKLLVHCAGSLPLSVLKKYSENIGVFYPLQTFSKSRDVDFNKIPIFIEANSSQNEKLLLQIANEISGSVSVINSEKRKMLHISAVFACNFVNHFYTIAADILKSKDIQFDVLRPLILETAQKVQELEPEEAQTGPAIRFDENIINSHLNELKEFGDYQQLYNSISKSIFDRYKK
ncbi:DUF2520 domain-containing protein [Draconibacterium sp.]|jgi:predicted short-subunit dehydrogenase-like oxidoreductase (DUF2520 family)